MSVLDENTASLPGHYLYPAYIFADQKAHLVTTVLGSCIAVCLYDPLLKIGGINHFMLPLWNGQGLASPKYGNIAIAKLLEKMIGFGCKKHNLIAKVFGGAESLEQSESFYQIGKRNIILAEETLANEKIKVLSQSTGGNQGRNIKYNTGTGEVMLRYIQKRSNIEQPGKKPVVIINKSKGS
jgi:chemotaxis protein CheD